LRKRSLLRYYAIYFCCNGPHASRRLSRDDECTAQEELSGLENCRGSPVSNFFVHVDLVFVIPNDHIPAQSVIDFLTSILCMIMMPLLFAGVSKPREETESQRNHEDELPEEISKFEAKNGGLNTYTRTADKSIFFIGNAAAAFDLFFNGHDGLIPVTAIAALLTTYLLVFLTAHVLAHRMIETWILSTATVALVGIGYHFNIMNLFGIYSDDLIGYGSSSPIYESLWYEYAILFLMITSNRRLAKQNEDQPYSSNQTPEALHLILSFRAGPDVWQVRNSRVAISLVLACISSLCGDTWPLAVDTTIASLGLYVIAVGFRRLPEGNNDEEDRSKPHLAIFVFCVLTTVAAPDNQSPRNC